MVVCQTENAWKWVWTSLVAGLFSWACESEPDSPTKHMGSMSMSMASADAAADAASGPGPTTDAGKNSAPPGAAANANAAAKGGSGARAGNTSSAGAGGAIRTAAAGPPSAGSAAPAAGSGGQSEPALEEIPAADSFARVEAEQFGMPKIISDQFDLAEGPVWDHCEQRLLFADVNHRTIHSLVPGGEVGVFVEQTNYVNGMLFDRQGHMLLAEMGGGSGGRITRMRRDKTIEILVDKNPSGGRLQTTDDLTLRSDGTIYFSDPIISHGPYLNDLGSLLQHPFYMLRAGTVEPVRLGTQALPNGIRLSRDETKLYVAAFIGDKVVQYDVAADGSLSMPIDLTTELDAADSMCLDIAGNLYVGVRTGLQVLRPDGSKVTQIPIESGRGTTNCAFGGPEGKTLFVTAWNTLSQIDDMPVPGLEWAKNRNMPCN